MIEQAYLFADEFGWCLKESVVNGDGAIPGDSPPDFLAKVILQVPWSGTDQLDMLSKAV